MPVATLTVAMKYIGRFTQISQLSDAKDILVLFLVLIFMLYIFSLPLQVLAYFIIENILYYNNYAKQYQTYFKRIILITVSMIQNDFISDIKEFVFSAIRKKNKSDD